MGVAQRRVVDDAAVPIMMHLAVASADVGPGKLRRNAAACQDVVWLDRGWLGVADFLIGEPCQHAAFHIHRGNHEGGGLVSVEHTEINMVRQCLQQLMRVVEVSPGRRG